MRCRSILLISDHPRQQGIRKGGGPDFWSQTDRGQTELRILVVGWRSTCAHRQWGFGRRWCSHWRRAVRCWLESCDQRTFDPGGRILDQKLYFTSMQLGFIPMQLGSIPTSCHVKVGWIPTDQHASQSYPNIPMIRRCSTILLYVFGDT